MARLFQKFNILDGDRVSRLFQTWLLMSLTFVSEGIVNIHAGYIASRLF